MNCLFSGTSFVPRLCVLHDRNWPENRRCRRRNVSLHMYQHICNTPFITVQNWGRDNSLTLGDPVQHCGSSSSSPQELAPPVVVWRACGAHVMRTGRKTGLMSRMMRLGRWKEKSERLAPQRDELAARLGSSFCDTCVFFVELCDLSS